MNYFIYQFETPKDSILYQSQNLTLEFPAPHQFRSINTTNINRFFPSGLLPEEADYFIVPFLIKSHNQNQELAEIIQSLEYFSSYKRKHVFFLTGKGNYLTDSIVFNDNCKKDSLSLPFFTNTILNIEDSGEPINLVPNNLCSTIPDSKTLANSKFLLCYKTLDYFFDAMAFGRIPVLLYDDIKLPLEGKIPYQDFVLRIPEKEIKNVLSYLPKIDIVKASIAARKWWSFYFSDSSFHRFLEDSLKKKVPLC